MLIKLLFILICILMAGGYYIVLPARTEEKSLGERVMIAVASSFFTLCFITTALVVFQCYSLPMTTAVCGVVAGILLAVVKKSGKSFVSAYIGTSHWIVGVILFAALCLYVVFPTKYMLAGRDPGLYFLNGIHIAETGSMQYDTDEYLNEHFEELKDVIHVGYPALFSPYDFENMDGQPGDISPQFMPMFPSLLAVGYDLKGIGGLIRVNGLISLLSILVIYYFVKHMFSWKAGALTAACLILNPAQLWGARITETEILSQLLFFFSMYLFEAAWRKKDRRIFALAGVFLGIGAMNRIDTYIYGVGLYFMMAYCILWKPSYKRDMFSGCLWYTITGAAAYIYGWMFSTAYFIMHHENHSLSLIVGLNVLCMVLVLIIYLLNRGNIWKQMPNVIRLIVRNQRNLGFACIATGVLFLFAYVVRPHLKDSFNNRAMVEFCWYTSVIMTVAAIYGIYRAFEKFDEDYERYMVFVAIAVASMVAYIARPSISPDHIWAGRRWVTVNIPEVLIFGSLGILQIRLKYKGTQTALRAVLAGSVLLFLAGQSRPFLFTRIMDGIDSQYENLASHMSDDNIYFVDSGELAAYLRFIYHKQVYRLNNENLDELESYLKEHKELYYVGSQGALGKTGFQYEVVEKYLYTISGKYLNKTIGSFPTALFDRKIPASVYHLQYDDDNLMELNEGFLYVQNGSYDSDTSITTTGEPGTVFYGPGMELGAGTYEVNFQVTSEDGKNMDFLADVAAGGQTLTEVPVTQEGQVVLKFELDESTQGIEIRLFDHGGTKIKCKNIVLKKLNSE